MCIIGLSVRAQKFLDNFDRNIRERIENRLRNLKGNPVPSDVKFIRREKGLMLFRYRIGDYRVLYKFMKKDKIILVTKIDKRPRVYSK